MPWAGLGCPSCSALTLTVPPSCSGLQHAQARWRSSPGACCRPGCCWWRPLCLPPREMQKAPARPCCSSRGERRTAVRLRQQCLAGCAAGRQEDVQVAACSVCCPGAGCTPAAPAGGCSSQAGMLLLPRHAATAPPFRCSAAPAGGCSRRRSRQRWCLRCCASHQPSSAPASTSWASTACWVRCAALRCAALSCEVPCRAALCHTALRCDVPCRATLSSW